MDNALYKRISTAMTRAEKKAEKRKGHKLTPDQMEAIDEQICVKYGVTGDDFFLASMERAIV